jgi:hypothetical protein
VLALLATTRDHITTKSWDNELSAKFIDAVLSETPQRPVHLTSKLDPLNPATAAQGDAPGLLEDWIDSHSVCLTGAAGTGKSTALLDMQPRGAERNAVVLVADAEDYKPGRLGALMPGEDAARAGHHRWVKVAS